MCNCGNLAKNEAILELVSQNLLADVLCDPVFHCMFTKVVYSLTSRSAPKRDSSYHEWRGEGAARSSGESIIQPHYRMKNHAVASREVEEN